MDSTSQGCPHAPTGYTMIESVEIENFRLFSKAQASGFRRFNLVVGDNSAGKTSFLEALFTACANSAEIGARLREWRGLEMGPASPQDLYDGIFGSLFHEFEKGRIGSVSIRGTNYDTRSVRFFYDTKEPILLPLQEPKDQSAGLYQSYTPVTFEWKDVNGHITRSTPQISQKGITFPPSLGTPHDPTFMAARTPITSVQNATWFSDQSKVGEEAKIVAAIRAHFADVESLNVEVEMGSPAIFIKYPWLRRKIPISLASDGMNKLVAMLLHISHSRGTATFVDEIENGFHFSSYERICAQVLDFTKTYDNQVFAATHSFEFLRSCVPVIEKNQKDFTLIRVYKQKGLGNIKVIDGKKAVSMILGGFETRL